MKMMKGLEHLLYDKRLRGLEFFTLVKRRLRRDLINEYKYLEEESKEDRVRLFSVVCSDMSRGRKLKHRSFPLNIRKHFPL